MVTAKQEIKMDTKKTDRLYSGERAAEAAKEVIQKAFHGASYIDRGYMATHIDKSIEILSKWSSAIKEEIKIIGEARNKFWKRSNVFVARIDRRLVSIPFSQKDELTVKHHIESLGGEIVERISWTG